MFSDKTLFSHFRLLSCIFCTPQTGPVNKAGSNWCETTIFYRVTPHLHQLEWVKLTWALETFIGEADWANGRGNGFHRIPVVLHQVADFLCFKFGRDFFSLVRTSCSQIFFSHGLLHRAKAVVFTTRFSFLLLTLLLWAQLSGSKVWFSHQRHMYTSYWSQWESHAHLSG